MEHMFVTNGWEYFKTKICDINIEIRAMDKEQHGFCNGACTCNE